MLKLSPCNFPPINYKYDNFVNKKRFHLLGGVLIYRFLVLFSEVVIFYVI